MQSTTQNSLPDIAVIGGGPSGLVSIRHLKEIANVTAFEAKDDVGGMWYYTSTTEENHPNLDQDPYHSLYGHLHSSLYDKLYTNVPKEMMTFKDFLHKDETPYIMEASTFFEYTKEYARKFDLYDNLKLQTVVNKVRLVSNMTPDERKACSVPSDTTKKYCLSYCTVQEPNKGLNSLFDYIFVCNGHFSKANWPLIEGQATYEGVQMHMHSLRKLDKERFDNKRILVVGTHVSANDILALLFFYKHITKEINPKQVIITGRRTEHLEKSTDYNEQINSGKLIIKKGGLQRFSGGKKATFRDGTEEEVDTVIYATGYLYSFPFLDGTADNLVEFDNEAPGLYFGPLYKKIFSIKEPTPDLHWPGGEARSDSWDL